MNWSKSIVIIFLFINCLPFTIYAQDNIKIVVGNYPPYIDQNSQTAGVITQVVKQSLLLSGVDAEITYDDWPNIENRVSSEKVLSFMWPMNMQRQRDWLFSNPVYKTDVIIVANKNSRFYWKRYDQLRDYKLGLTRGFSYGALFDEYKSFLTYEESISDYISLKNLAAGKYDGAVIEKLMAKYMLSYLSKEKQNKIEFINEPQIDSASYYLVCAKGYSKCYSYIDAFNQGLKKLKQQGTYQKLLDK